MSRDRILIDMDDVIADFSAYLWHRTGHLTNLDEAEDQTQRYLTDHCPTVRSAERMREIVNEPHFFASLKPIDGAQSAIDELINFGYDVWIVSKPLESNPSCASDKYQWVECYFPRLAEKVILTPDKGMVTGRLLIDDAPKPKWIPYASWVPVIYSNVWNHNLLPGCPRLHSWDDFNPSLIEEWSKLVLW